MDQLRVALAQINVTVGDLSGNTKKIQRHIDQAREASAQIVAFPELAVSGYPPEDLLLKPAFGRACRKAVEEIARCCHGLVAIVGFPEQADDLYNSAAIIAGGEVVAVYRKQYLPNYGVFDEDRYFKPGEGIQVFSALNLTFGVSICEDIWYPTGPSEIQALHGGAELLINISASPYHAGKSKVRERMLATRATDNVSAVAFCNLVGGQDELIFDGGSVIFDSQGNLLARGKHFEEDLVLADVQLDEIMRHRLLDPRRRKHRLGSAAANSSVHCVPIILGEPNPSPPHVHPTIIEPLGEVAEVYQALTLGVHDYVGKNRFQKVVIGLSGGIDSSLVAVLAADALGAENVVGVSMPSQYSSDHSKSDAACLGRSLNIRFLTIPIEQIFESYLSTLSPVFAGGKHDITEENLQARIRGTILMALSNKYGWLVLTTGNKSENSVGYATLYGDMAGGFAVIKDVPKTLVYQLARHRNSRAEVIPENVFVKPPSAELRPDQKDSDSLPEYADLDPIIAAYVEQNRSFHEMLSDGFEGTTVQKVVQLVDRAEYKRRQAPPGIKITSRAFGKDRRLPITNRYVEE